MHLSVSFWKFRSFFCYHMRLLDCIYSLECTQSFYFFNWIEAFHILSYTQNIIPIKCFGVASVHMRASFNSILGTQSWKRHRVAYLLAFNLHHALVVNPFQTLFKCLCDRLQIVTQQLTHTVQLFQYQPIYPT